MSISHSRVRLNNADGEQVKPGNPFVVNPIGIVSSQWVDDDSSDLGGFSALTMEQLFDGAHHTAATDSSATNPKYIDIYFKSPIPSVSAGLWTSTGSFKNTKIILYTGPLATTVIDESADSTAKTILAPEYEGFAFDRIRYEFHTADAVSVERLIISTAHDVRAQISGLDTDGDVQTGQFTPEGYFLVADVSDGLAIAEGMVTGKSFVHKFGSAPDFDTTDGEITIWDGADDGNINQMVYQYSSTADIDSISSSDNSDTQSMEIQGLDTNGTLTVQTKALQGQTKVTLDTALKRVFRMKNVGSTDMAGQVYCYVDSAITAGVPDDSTKVRAVIDNGNNQTEMAIYTIPAGKSGYIRGWYASTAGASKATNYLIRVKARPDGQVFQLKHKMAWTGDQPYHHKYEEPEGPFAAGTDIEITAELTAAGVLGAAVSAGFDLVLVDD